MSNRNDRINESWANRLQTYGNSPDDINDFVVRRRLQTGQPQDGGSMSPDTDGRRILTQLDINVLEGRKHTRLTMDDSSLAMRDSVAYMHEYDYTPELAQADFPSPFTRMDHKKRPKH
jgi:hypothetical protein